MRIGGITIVDAICIRKVARAFYPEHRFCDAAQAHRLQRQWLRAYRLAPGCRVQIGPRPDAVSK